MNFKKYYRFLLEALDNVKLLPDNIKLINYQEYVSNYGGSIEKIVSFYNVYLPKSARSVSRHRELYQRPDTIVWVAIDVEKNNKLISLLESYHDSDGERLLSTGATDIDYRKMNIYKNLWVEALKQIPENVITCHFRDSNMKQLYFYKSLGFKNEKNVGEYMNGEVKWEMVYYNK